MYPSTIKILVVDDSDTIRDLMHNELIALGFKNIELAEDGEDALKKMHEAQAAKAPIKLIISDWNMPKMSGLDFLKAVRTLPDGSKIPFILLTSEAEMSNVWTAIDAGVSSYIVKPLAPGVLVKKLEEVYKKFPVK